MPTDADIQAARDAFDRATKQLAAVLDYSVSGNEDARDPTSDEQEDFETAGLALGRLLNKRAAAEAKRATRGASYALGENARDITKGKRK